MATSLKKSTAALREAVLKLEPTGENGFEGLLAVILGRITGETFRLANSGLQLGVDGAAVSDARHVSFEGKLYTGNINKNEVLSKITAIIASSAPPDLWVLGATIGINSQLSGLARTAAEKNGISILFLDWPASASIPPLAAACALARDETIGFLSAHVTDTACVYAADAALAYIAASQPFEIAAAHIAAPLREPCLGIPLALKANAKWLSDTFRDRRRAKEKLGQALAPGASGAMPTRYRGALVSRIKDKFAEAPSGEIVAVLGGEGTGKSWLIAQSWLSTGSPPLTLVIPATDLKLLHAAGVDAVLVTKLIEQTGDSPTDFIRKRWKDRFRKWRDETAPATPRLVVCFDGLNEQPDFDWRRWLDGAAQAIEGLGGILIVTSREAYFADHVQSCLISRIAPVRVSAWTHADLNEVLSENGVDPETVKASVRERLRNPRILGIAFELLTAGRVQNFEELSVERLLFEHIRIGARDGTTPETPDQFAARLASHAREIIDRAKEQRREDLLIFELGGNGTRYELSPGLLAVTAEHFFTSRGDDPSLYELTGEGLKLALGLSIIKTLKRAERNDASPAEALDELLEPIAALDLTAEAAFAATLISSVDERCSPAIREALVCGYLRLQNLDAADYPVFAAAVRNMVDPAMNAVSILSTSVRHAPHKDWLIAALRDVRNDDNAWEIISRHVSSWLRFYSLAPELRVMSRAQDDAAKHAEDVKAREQSLETRWLKLSEAERHFIDKEMTRLDRPDVSRRIDDAIMLLAGMPLAEFATSLVAWTLSQAINSSHHSSYDQFLALIRFNKRDWVATREQLLAASAFLTAEETSSTGQWALVAVHRALSTREDAERDHALVEALTIDREKYGSWRLIETYCATDPCDPASVEPENLQAASEKFGALDVENFHRSRSMGEEDHFFRDVLPAMARFRPEIAQQVVLKFAGSVLKRLPAELAYCVPSLRPFSAAFDSETVEGLLELAHELSVPHRAESQESKDKWIASQFALFCALPHLDGDTQIRKLRALPPHGPPLLNLTEVLQKASPEELENMLEQALKSADPNRQFMALAFARHSGTLVSGRANELILEMALAEKSEVKSEAFAAIAKLQDPEAIRAIVDKGWTAKTLSASLHDLEVWYGSVVMIRAGKLGILDAPSVVPRISPLLYDYAVKELGQVATSEIAGRLKCAVQRSLGLDLTIRPPLVEQRVDERSDYPPRLSLVEPENVPIEVALKQMSELPEEYAERQETAWKAVSDFEAQLTQAEAHLISQHVKLPAVQACVSNDPPWGTELAEMILAAPRNKFYFVKNFALLLARSLSGHDPSLARRLFDRVTTEEGFLRLTYGVSAVSMDAVSVWGADDSENWTELRKRRLDESASDHDLAQEVLAACFCKKGAFVERYARELLKAQEPAAIARGLMILGFGDASPQAEKHIRAHADAKGLLGKAARAAQYAYERNKWAKHWFRRMCEANSAFEFWRWSNLFLKIVDGRFDLWDGDISRADAATRFEPSITSRIEQRIKSWKSKREKKLFGENAPLKIFVAPD